MSIFTFISRKLPAFRARKRLPIFTAPISPSLLWKKPLRPRIKRAKHFISIENRRWRHLYVIPAPASNLSWKSGFLISIGRGSWPIRRRKYLILPPSGPPPSNLSFKKLPRPRIRRKRWSFIRKRYVIPAPASNLSWRKFKPPRIRRRRWAYIRHPYVVPAAVQPPSNLNFKKFPRPRIKRKRWKFLRHLYVVPVAAATFIPKQRRLLRVHRRKLFPRHLGKYAFSAPPASPAIPLQKVWRVFLTRPRR